MISKMLVFLFLLLCATISFAEQTRSILLVFNDANPHQVKLKDRLLDQTASFATKLSVNSAAIQTLSRTQALTQPDIIISLGPEVSIDLLKRNPIRPILHVLVTRNQAQQLFPCLPACKMDQAGHGLLLLDQPIQRQFKLIQLALPQTEIVGILTSQLATPDQSQHEQAARQLGMQVHFEFTGQRLLGSHIEALSKQSDVILARPDPEIFNPSTIPEILLTSYRHRVPVIGFSSGFVRAGAIAALVTSLDQFAEQILDICLNPEIPFAGKVQLIDPSKFEVVTNRDVARSLSLRFEDDALLRAKIEQHELAN